MNTILVATIGTRDLMYQTTSGLWYNIGDDQMQEGEIIGEQAEVLADLNLGQTTFRALTQYFYEHLETYRPRLKPVILGQLLADQAPTLGQVYLIGTDQGLTVPQRKKDSVFACELIKDWLAQTYQVPADVITLGTAGENPSNFEQMFRWWQRVWRDTIQPQPEQPILLCLKGCVAQTAEAARIAGLSAHGDRIQFFDFIQTTEINRQGRPSPYSGPLLGTNYLWDRAQQQALQMLDRYDYAGVYNLLTPYMQQNTAGFGAVPTWLEAGMAWNQGELQTFLQRAKSTLPPAAQKQGQQWWWMAYEQAQLATIRLEQKYTAEALLHSARAVEGLMWEWAITQLPDYVQPRAAEYPILRPGVRALSPQLQAAYDKTQTQFPHREVQMRTRERRLLLEAVLPATAQSPDFAAFWNDVQTARNRLSHRLGGISEKEVLQAWGQDIRTPPQWQQRLLSCLNIISGQSFKTLAQASLFTQVHDRVKARVTTYQPQMPVA
ncbi:MAG: hypothetical protein ACFCVD_02860 [Nodosilinea sp.]